MCWFHGQSFNEEMFEGALDKALSSVRLNYYDFQIYRKFI